jgi:hypothetical protein
MGARWALFVATFSLFSVIVVVCVKRIEIII